MTLEHSRYLLEKHTALFNHMETNPSNYPDPSTDAINEIWQAFSYHNPEYRVCFSCPSSIIEMLQSANHLRKRLSSQFYTFPKQE
jgi:hypothetical protein